MRVNLVGIDCATEAARVGIALGWTEANRACVERVLQCSDAEPPAATIDGWLRILDGPILLAVDAPLGWPASLVRALGEHRAGEEITVAPNEMFRRDTDRFVQRILKKTPLDVGADRIARTAHAALDLLGELRRRLAHPIPLAWDPASEISIAAIEVYPAATLKGRGLTERGYKASDQVRERRDLIAERRRFIELPVDTVPMEKRADALDAAICLLAAADFCNRRASPPRDRVLAEKEGWIWFWDSPEARANVRSAADAETSRCGKISS